MRCIRVRGLVRRSWKYSQKNVMYLGHTVGLRRTTISYKN